MSELCVRVSECVNRYVLVLSRCVQFEAEVTCEPSGCTGVCVSRSTHNLCTWSCAPSVSVGSVGGCGCVRAQLCVHVHGGGKALAASPSLQHSLSFTPGRLLRNVSGREAKNILSPPPAHCLG